MRKRLQQPVNHGLEKVGWQREAWQELVLDLVGADEATLKTKPYQVVRIPTTAAKREDIVGDDVVLTGRYCFARVRLGVVRDAVDWKLVL